MKKIELTQGKVALVDDDDYEYLNQWKWHTWDSGYTYYAVRNIKINGVRSKTSMHRLIMKTPIDMQVDHIDHNGLNNQKANLRNCTHSENHKNVSSHGKSKYLGVSYFDGLIRAQIRANGKVIHIGLFKTEEEAARAYDNAAKKYHNEFANLNFK